MNAREKLKKYVDRNKLYGIPAIKIAERLGISPVHLSMILNNKRILPKKSLIKCQQITGIEPKEWLILKVTERKQLNPNLIEIKQKLKGVKWKELKHLEIPRSTLLTFLCGQIKLSRERALRLEEFTGIKILEEQINES